MPKIFKVVGFIVLAFLILITALYFTLKLLHNFVNLEPDPAPLQIRFSNNQDDWNKYSDSILNFLYPKDLEVITDTESTFSAKSPQYRLDFDWDKNSRIYEDRIDEIKNTYDSYSISIKDQDGYKVYFDSRMSAEGNYSREVFIPHDGGIVQITVSSDTNGVKDEAAILRKVEYLADQIVKTIKFK